MEQFNCEKCSKSYLHKTNLLRHVASKHKELDFKYECNDCQRKFNRKDALTRHIWSLHSSPTLSYKCDRCQRKFNRKDGMIRHIRMQHKHKLEHSGNDRYRCTICETLSFSRRIDAVDHLQKLHDIKIRTHNLEFSSEAEFYKWKYNEEEKLTCQFKKAWTKKCKSYVTTVFVCSRSGNYSPNTKGKRRSRLIGSKKINGFCPAEIKLFNVLGSSFCKGTYTSIHIGHVTCDERELVYMKLNENEGNKTNNSLTSCSSTYGRIKKHISDSIVKNGNTKRKSFPKNNQYVHDIELLCSEPTSEGVKNNVLEVKAIVLEHSELLMCCRKGNLVSLDNIHSNNNDKASNVTMHSNYIDNSEVESSSKSMVSNLPLEVKKLSKRMNSIFQSITNLDQLNEVKNCMALIEAKMSSQQYSIQAFLSD